MENQKEHKHFDKIDDISKKVEQCERLQQYFKVTLEKYFNDIEAKNKNIKDSKQLSYNECVFIYK